MKEGGGSCDLQFMFASVESNQECFFFQLYVSSNLVYVLSNLVCVIKFGISVIRFSVCWL